MNFFFPPSHNGGVYRQIAPPRPASPPAVLLTRPSPALVSCVSLCVVQQLYDQTLVGTKIGSEKVSHRAAPHSHPHPRGS